MQPYETKIALQLYTLRDHLKTIDQIKRTLEQVRSIGYQCVEIAGLGDVTTEELKQILDANELCCISAHESLDNLINNINEVADKARILDTNYITLGYPGNDYWSAEGIKKMAGILDQAGQQLKVHGIQLAYHNHDNEFEKFSEKIALEEIYSLTNKEHLHAELDTYWVQMGGGDIVDWILKLKDRMGMIHFKDMQIKNALAAMAEIGNGNLNWPKIIETCEKTNIQWYIVEQDICENDPFESVKISLNYLKSLNVK